jgi:hypothetical protein
MTDVFIEHLVKRRPNSTDMIKRSGLIFGVLLIMFLSSTFVPMIAPFLTVGAGFGAFILHGRLNKEYEYILTNAELDIDVIYNRRTRKHLVTLDVKGIEVMAHVSDTKHAHSMSNAQETFDYGTGAETENTYAFITTHGGKRTKFIIEPNEKLKNAFSNILKRKFNAR